MMTMIMMEISTAMKKKKKKTMAIYKLQFKQTNNTEKIQEFSSDFFSFENLI